MIILRNKLFGKFDRQLAKQQGVTVEELRARRLGYEGGKSAANDMINLRTGKINHGAGKKFDVELRDRIAIDYPSARAQRIQQETLDRFKAAKLSNGEDSKKAYEMTKQGTAEILNRRAQVHSQRYLKRGADRQMNALERLVNEKPKVKQSPKTNPAPTQPVNPANKVKTTNPNIKNSGIFSRGRAWAKKNKALAAGIGAVGIAGAATGAYGLSSKKK